MDLDHLHALVTAARDEADALNDAGPAYDDLLLYLEVELPRAFRLMRRPVPDPRSVRPDPNPVADRMIRDARQAARKLVR